MTRLYGRAEKGKRANSKKPSSKGERTTIISGIELTGLVGSFIFKGFLTKELFKLYLSEVLLPELKKGTLILMDNSSSHKGSEIEELIESRGFFIKYLPRYSPEFNPIELSWSKIKNYVKSKAPRTLKEIENCLSEAIRTITTNDSINYIRHCGYSLNKVI